MTDWNWENYKPTGERYTIPELIRVLEFRILIHETYAGLVVQNPSQYPPRIYGDYEFQMWAIKGYEDAIYYLEGDTEMESKHWFYSKTVWINLLMAAGIVVQAVSGDAWLNVEAQGAIIVVVNLILRLITGKPLGK